MPSKVPYLFRAFYDWAVDSQGTPYVVLDTKHIKKAGIPPEAIQNPETTLNISPIATRDLQINQKELNFRTCFSGKIFEIHIPMQAIISLYVKETGEGIVFNHENVTEDTTNKGKGLEGSFLTLIK